MRSLVNLVVFELNLWIKSQVVMKLPVRLDLEWCYHPVCCNMPMQCDTYVYRNLTYSWHTSQYHAVEDQCLTQ